MSEHRNVCPFALSAAGEYSLLEGTSGKERKQEIWLRECQPQYTPGSLGVKTCAVQATVEIVATRECRAYAVSVHKILR